MDGKYRLSLSATQQHSQERPGTMVPKLSAVRGLPTSENAINFSRLSLQPGRIMEETPISVYKTQRMSVCPSKTRRDSSPLKVGGMAQKLSQMALQEKTQSADEYQQPGGRSSIFSGTSAVTTKDPRPIREKAFQHECIRTIIKFLAENMYDKPISFKTLSNPSAKDFQSIFKFLYERIDPKYEWKGKFEEEVPALLKAIKYPFCGDIGKSHLCSIGSMYSWPYILSMLHWVVMALGFKKICDDVEQDTEDYRFYLYLVDTYKAFLAGDDDYASAAQSERVRVLEERNEEVAREKDAIDREIEKLLEESKEYEKSGLAQLEMEKTTIGSDIDKHVKHIAHLEEKKLKYQQLVEKLCDELVHLEKDVQEAENERNAYVQKIERQDFNIDDINRMAAEREALAEELERLRVVKDDLRTKKSDVDLRLRKTQERIQEGIDEINVHAEKLVLECRAVNAEPDTVDTVIEECNLRCKLYENEISQYHKESSELSMCIDKQTEAYNDKMDSIKRLEMDVKHYNKEYYDKKDCFKAENEKYNADAVRIERELSTLKNEIEMSSLTSEQEVQMAKLEYDSFCQRLAEEQDMIIKEVSSAMKEYKHLKKRIQNQLDDFNEWIETQREIY